ncbi:nuclear transport factor 2 family protein [Solimonas variicoloris]|uniref:nuclear transport factor 2 family protein n=1 Tax=Solimonas variicoloris TaxID=254408 RepID=UPI0003694805|nr:nuclear transport factor 2 family protein [Solimonas variicoloris]
MTATDTADLLRRIQRLEAIREIEQLKYRYWRACDRKDPDAFRECFVREGADIDYGVIGKFSDREPLVQVFAQIATARTAQGTWLVHDIHHGKHPTVELLDERSATGEWTLWFMQVNNQDKTVTQLSMEYRDTYVIEDGRWKIAKSHVTPMSTLSFPLPEGAFTVSIPVR